MGFGHDLGPKPNDAVEAALWTFATLSNWGNLHPEDDRRFMEFIGVAAAEKSQWKASDVENRLLGYGLPKELAQKLGQRFWDRMKPVENEEIRKLKREAGSGSLKTRLHEGCLETHNETRLPCSPSALLGRSNELNDRVTFGADKNSLGGDFCGLVTRKSLVFRFSAI
jgi:hypothetical protein